VGGTLAGDAGAKRAGIRKKFEKKETRATLARESRVCAFAEEPRRSGEHFYEL